MRLSSLVCAVRLIQLWRDKRWVPEELQGLSFFGQDQWVFVASESDNMCSDCDAYNGQVFLGYELRREFPYLEIVDANMIYPRVHPHCGCELIRLTKNKKL
jgi:hypothetical protein